MMIRDADGCCCCCCCCCSFYCAYSGDDVVARPVGGDLGHPNAVAFLGVYAYDVAP